jgi:hypothetical protein
MLRRGVMAGLVAALALAAASQGAVSSTIYAYFDVDGGLQFRYSDSSNVGSTIPPGTYTINLNNNGADDLGVDHIFHLTGPGVDYTAPNVDTNAVFSVTFQAGGTYRVFDNLNPKISETIVATTAPAPPTPNPLPPSTPTSSSKPTSSGVVGSQVHAAALPFRGSLIGTVSSSGTVALATNGKPVTSLKAGRYTVQVTDSSAKAGFNIQEVKNDPITVTTGVFTGKRSKILTLRAGQWFFYPTFVGKKTYFIVVS